jgi:ribosomal protein S18 acetylase RimI-like enzyme
MRDDTGANAGAVTPAFGTSPAPRDIVARNGTVLEVQPLAAARVAALQRFNAGLSERTRSVFLPHAYDDETVRRYAARSEQAQDRAYLLYRGSEVVGYFFLWEFNKPVPILGLGLADTWQGQGLGEPMLRLPISDARTADRDAIELTTVPTNERALRLYQRVGFEEIGETDNIAGDGRIVRERRMFVALKPGARPRERSFKPPAL